MKKKLKKEALLFSKFIRDNGIRTSHKNRSKYFWEDFEGRKKIFTPTEIYIIFKNK